MKRFLLIAIGLCCSIIGWTQSKTKIKTYPINATLLITKDYGGLKKGEKVFVKELQTSQILEQNMDSYNTNKSFLLIDDVLVGVDKSFKNHYKISYESPKEVWGEIALSNLDENKEKLDIPSKIINDLELDAKEYIKKIKENNWYYEDPFLENYIYGLLPQIVPESYVNNRILTPGIIFLNNPNPKIAMFANGVIVINTGLLAALHTEDELVALLINEIAHFTLNHSAYNVHKQVLREKRAAFWSGLLTGLTAIGEGFAFAKTNYGTPGIATMATAALTTTISNKVNKRAGLNFTKKQNLEADDITTKLLQTLKYDPNALATALCRIQEAQINEQGLETDSVSDYDIVFPLSERIANAGTPQINKKDDKFEKIISRAITQTAFYRFENYKFKQVIPMVSQNIDHRVASPDDYVLKANCLMFIYNDSIHNQQALLLAQKAKSIEPTYHGIGHINAYTAEITACLRLGQKDSAIKLLQEYATIQKNTHPTQYENNNEYIWARNMLRILQQM